MSDKVTIAALQQMKRDGKKSVGVVAWDYQLARIADRAGFDFVSVGDSVGAVLILSQRPFPLPAQAQAQREAVVQRATLAVHHRDPFDRILIAQSIEEKLPLTTADPIFERYPIDVIW